MKELLKQYASYNAWANQRLCEIILALPAEKQKQELLSSFKSLFATVVHMWDTESVWFQRIKMQERTIAPSENFSGELKDAINGLMQQNAVWIEWIGNASEAALEHVFQYYNSKKEYFKQPVWQVLMHVINHATFHRGQLINMLRQLGEEKLPGTDFVLWCRLKR
jgi:uncharacterized damage-inducible protein DinB